jgi:hypothetical protein
LTTLKHTTHGTTFDPSCSSIPSSGRRAAPAALDRLQKEVKTSNQTQIQTQVETERPAETQEVPSASVEVAEAVEVEAPSAAETKVPQATRAWAATEPTAPARNVFRTHVADLMLFRGISA